MNIESNRGETMRAYKRREEVIRKKRRDNERVIAPGRGQQLGVWHNPTDGVIIYIEGDVRGFEPPLDVMPVH